jgi:hypothetical protein
MVGAATRGTDTAGGRATGGLGTTGVGAALSVDALEGVDADVVAVFAPDAELATCSAVNRGLGGTTTGGGTTGLTTPAAGGTIVRGAVVAGGGTVGGLATVGRPLGGVGRGGVDVASSADAAAASAVAAARVTPHSHTQCESNGRYQRAECRKAHADIQRRHISTQRPRTHIPRTTVQLHSLHRLTVFLGRCDIPLRHNAVVACSRCRGTAAVPGGGGTAAGVRQRRLRAAPGGPAWACERRRPGAATQRRHRCDGPVPTAVACAAHPCVCSAVSSCGGG